MAIDGNSSIAIWASGENGKALLYSGSSWSDISPLITTNTLMGIFSINSTTAIFTGDNSTILKYNVVEGWSTYLYDIPHIEYTAIAGTSSDDIWIAGGKTTFTHFDGSSWQTVATDANVTIYDMAVLDNQDIFVTGGGGSGRLILRLYRAGNMTSYDTDIPGIGQGVWGTNSSNIWVVGNTTNTTTGDIYGAIWNFNGSVISADNSLADTDTSFYIFRDIWGVNGTTIWTVGENSNEQEGVVMGYNGTHWKLQKPLPNEFDSGSDSESFYSITGKNATNLITAGTGEYLYIYQSETWIKNYTDSIPDTIYGIWGNGEIYYLISTDPSSSPPTEIYEYNYTSTSIFVKWDDLDANASLYTIDGLSSSQEDIWAGGEYNNTNNMLKGTIWKLVSTFDNSNWIHSSNLTDTIIAIDVKNSNGDTVIAAGKEGSIYMRREPSLHLSISANTTTPITGDYITLTIYASTNYDMRDVNVTISLPEGLNYLSSEANRGNLNENNMVWRITDSSSPVLLTGSTATLTIKANVTAFEETISLSCSLSSTPHPTPSTDHSTTDPSIDLIVYPTADDLADYALSSPEDSEIEVSLNYEFEVTTYDPNDDDIEEIQWQICEDEGCNNIIKSGTWTGLASSSDEEIIYIYPTALSCGKEYYWRVKQTNSEGVSWPIFSSPHPFSTVLCSSVKMGGGGWGDYDWMHPEPQGNRLKEAISFNATSIFAVGEMEMFIKWDDDYEGYILEDMNLTGDIEGIWGTNTSNIWIVGENGLISQLNENEIVTYDIYTDIEIEDIWGVNSSEIWAVGDHGTIWQWDGNNWSNIDNCTSNYLNAIEGYNSTLILTGGEEGALCKWDGSSWNTISLSSTADIFDLTVFSPTNIWIVGEGGFAQKGSLQDNGTILWTDYQLSTEEDINTIKIAYNEDTDSSTYDSNTIWIATANGNIYFFNGSGWTSVSSPTSLSINTITGVSTDDLWAFGDAGQILHYDGGSWTLLSDNVTETLMGIWGYETTTEKNFWAVGMNGTILALDSDASCDGFSNETSPTLSNIMDTWAINKNSLWAVGEDGIIITYNAALEKFELYSSSPTSEDLFSIYGTSVSDIWAVGNSGTIIHYDGSSWSEYASSPTVQDLRGIWLYDSSTGWAVGEGAVLYWDGSSWTDKTSAYNLSAYNLYDIWGSDPNHIWTVGDNGTILYFNGQDWTSVAIPTTANLYTVWGGAQNIVFAAGESGTILYYNGSEWTLEDSGTSNTLFSLFGYWYQYDRYDLLAIGSLGTIINRHIITERSDDNETIDNADTGDDYYDDYYYYYEPPPSYTDTGADATGDIDIGADTIGDTDMGTDVSEEDILPEGDTLSEGDASSDTGDIPQDLPDEIVSQVEDISSQLDTLISGEGEEAIASAEEVLTNVDTMIDSLQEMASSGETAEAVMETVDTVVSAGVVAAALTGDADKAVETVDAIGDIAEQAIAATTQEGAFDTLATITDKTAETIDSVLSAIDERPGGDEVKTVVMDQMQEEVVQVSQTIADAIEDASPVDISKDTVSELTDSMSQMASVIVEGTEEGLNEKVLTSMTQVADKAVDLVIDEISRDVGLEVPSEAVSLEDIVTHAPTLVDNIVEVAGIDITQGVSIEKDTIAQVATEIGLPELQAAAVAEVVPQVVAPNAPIISAVEGESITPPDIITKALDKIGIKAAPETKPEEGVVNLDIGGVKVPVFLAAASIVSSKLPEGTYIMPHGVAMCVASGIAVEAGPAPAEPIPFTAALLDLVGPPQENEFSSGAITTGISGLDPTSEAFKELVRNTINMLPDGTIKLRLPDGSFVSAGLGYNVEKENSVSAGFTTFELSGDDPASEAFKALVRYEDGSVQALPPYLNALDTLGDILEKSGLKWNVERETGVITIENVGRFKPDYAIASIEGQDRIWFNGNKDRNGFAWKVQDFNGDGLIDFELWTENGRQIIYGLP